MSLLLSANKFSPLDIPILYDWYDSTQSSSFVLIGSSVQYWNTLTKSNNSLIQGTVLSQPTLTSNTINNRQGILYNATAPGMSLGLFNNTGGTHVNWMHSGTAASLVIIAKCSFAVADPAVVFASGLLTSVWMSNANSKIGVAISINGKTSVSYYFAPPGGHAMTDTCILELYYNGGSTILESSYSMYYNGVLQTFSTLVGSPVGNAPSNPSYIGTNTVHWFDNYINEVLYFQGTLTTEQRTNLTNYLTWKWL